MRKRSDAWISSTAAGRLPMAERTMSRQWMKFWATEGKEWGSSISEQVYYPATTQRTSLMAGTGIWAVEMAREFPKAQVVGLDLVPYATNELDLPSNLKLVLGDCAQGLAYPDGHFDIVHARLIVGGIRDWKALLDEVVRITKRGGLMVLRNLVVLGLWSILHLKEWERGFWTLWI
jgi:SAM-dependent methyltransferase